MDPFDPVCDGESGFLMLIQHTMDIIHGLFRGPQAGVCVHVVAQVQHDAFLLIFYAFDQSPGIGRFFHGQAAEP